MTKLTLFTSLLISALFLDACDQKELKPSDMKPVVTKPVVPKAESKPAPEAPKPTKKKLSELTTSDYLDILEAADWSNPASARASMGAWSTNTITAKKGDQKASVTIIEPSGKKEDPKASLKPRSPKELVKEFQAKGAAELLRQDFLLAVTIQGDPQGAKKLLAQIKAWIIVE